MSAGEMVPVEWLEKLSRRITDLAARCEERGVMTQADAYRICGDQIECLIADAQPAPDLWQPIETAPVGEEVLLYCPDRGVESNRERIELDCAHTSSGSHHSWATHWRSVPQFTTTDAQLASDADAIRRAVEEEREACAQIVIAAREWSYNCCWRRIDEMIADIRARGAEPESGPKPEEWVDDDPEETELIRRQEAAPDPEIWWQD